MRLKIASPILKDRARSLRSASTQAEAILWSRLRNGQVKRIRFRRQRPLGPYILDFYCPEFGLVIEIDGAHHTLPDNRKAKNNGPCT